MLDIAQLANVTHFVEWSDYLGTFAFAISGIRLAAGKGFDWFGAYVVGIVTAVGGGSIRDILLDIPIFWLRQPSYLIITMLALAATILFRKYLVRINHTLFFFDAVGLGLFTVVGVAKTFAAGYGWWLAISMGTITGSFGGMVRDILIREVPLIFRKDFYALACLSGGVIYVGLCQVWPHDLALVQLCVAISVVTLRILALKYHISIPTFRPEEE